MLTASVNRSALSWPGKPRQVVTPFMMADTRQLRSRLVGVVDFRVLKQML